MTNPIQARLDAIAWEDNDENFTIDGIPFRLDLTYLRKTTPEEVIVLKTKPFLKLYADMLGQAPTKRVLDVGLWQGGSALMFPYLFDCEKLVGIDIGEEPPAVKHILDSHPVGQRVKLYWETSQDDATKLGEILDREFDGPLDLIIDDASHWLDLTTRTFEITFPRLAPLGWYVIEDWAWAHMPAPPWPDQKALTNLVTRIIMAYACDFAIEQVIVKREALFIQKGKDAIVGKQPLSLDKMIWMPGRELVPF